MRVNVFLTRHSSIVSAADRASLKEPFGAELAINLTVRDNGRMDQSPVEFYMGVPEALRIIAALQASVKRLGKGI